MTDHINKFEKGYEAFKKGNWRATLAIWEPLAEQGISWAQHNVASIYYKGCDKCGIERDVMRANQLSSMVSGISNMAVIEIPSGDVLNYLNMVDPRKKKK